MCFTVHRIPLHGNCLKVYKFKQQHNKINNTIKHHVYHFLLLLYKAYYSILCAVLRNAIDKVSLAYFGVTAQLRHTCVQFRVDLYYGIKTWALSLRIF